MTPEAQLWIARLQLQPHPEGGWFRETYRAAEIIEKDHLPDRFGGERSFSTAIHFLLTADQVSAFHRLKQDEVWHFYDGSPLTIHVIGPSGDYSAIQLGRDFEKGQALQAVVPAACWFGAMVADGGEYSLVGCTVSPGFDFADFEMADRRELVAEFPQHQKIIERLTSA